MQLNISSLVGKTLINVELHDDAIIFYVSRTERYILYHEQDCCEKVSIEDIDGDIMDLLNSPILAAEEVTSKNVVKKQSKFWGMDLDTIESSYTWTFYKIRNVKASVTIRWFGESNGYYSESVKFEKYNRNIKNEILYYHNKQRSVL